MSTCNTADSNQKESDDYVKYFLYKTTTIVPQCGKPNQSKENQSFPHCLPYAKFGVN